jgi:hypothetical protein
MIYPRRNIMDSEKEVLVQMVIDLQHKLERKSAALQRVRQKLSVAKSKMTKMKGTVEFQRKRILELYPKNNTSL